MHSGSSSPPRERLAHDGVIAGLTLHDLRSYYDSLPAEAAAAVLATLMAALRHIHDHSRDLEELIASAKRIGKVPVDEGS